MLEALDQRLEDLTDATNHRVSAMETRLDRLIEGVGDRLDRFSMWFVGLAATGALSTIALAATILIRT